MLVIGVWLDHQEAAREQEGTYPLHGWECFGLVMLGEVSAT